MRRNRKRFSPTPLLVIVGGILLAVLAIAQNRQPSVQARAQANKKPAQASVRVTESTTVARKPLEYYIGSVREDLFAPPAPPAAAPKVEAPKVEPVAPPVAPAPVNPFVDFAYTGSIQMGDETVALIENAKTKEGMFLKVGDALVGGTITRITDREVEVSVAGRAERLQKNEDYKLVSLDKDAPFRTQQPGQPGQPGGPVPGMMPGFPGMPGMPGGMPGLPGMGMGGGGFGGFGAMNPDRAARMQQWMQNMSPEIRERFQQRMMNRQFEGGFGNRRRLSNQ